MRRLSLFMVPILAYCAGSYAFESTLVGEKISFALIASGITWFWFWAAPRQSKHKVTKVAGFEVITGGRRL